MMATVPVDAGKLQSKLDAKPHTGGLANAFVANFVQCDRDGRIIWTPEMGDHDERRSPIAPGDPMFDELVAGAWTVNNLADDGKEYMLDVGFRQATQATQVWGALFNDTPVDTDDPSTLTGEPSGNGYGAISWACNGTDFPTLALDTGNFLMTGVQKAYTASGGTIGPVEYFAFLSAETSRLNTDLLYCYMYLGATRTLLDTDVLNVTPAIRQS